MVGKILGFFLLIIVMTVGLVAYSLNTTPQQALETPSVVTEYKQKITDKTKELAAPVLSKLGIDVETVQSDDLNIVKKKIEDASSAVEDASQKITQ